MNKEKLEITREEKAILDYLIILGTPSYFRAKLWLLCSGAKKEIINNKNFIKIYWSYQGIFLAFMKSKF